MPLDPLLAELEENIADDLSVERLAGAGLLSRSQLYREFYSATGHSVKEYVRKRRLSKALALVKHTDTPLEQIAQECGFGSPQALCKSVKAAIGQTPMQYKAGGGEYYFPALEKRDLEGRAWQQPVTVAAETLPPTLCLRYYDSRLPGLEDRALAWLFAERPGYSGRVFGRNGKQEGSRLCYELYIESPDANRPAMTGAFAQIACPNVEREISAAWDYLYNDWLKTSMYTMADGQPWADMPYFEEYIHAGGQVRRLRLYLPVVKRPGFHKIQLCRCGEMRFLAARGSGADAEKAASKAVMDFLGARHPGLARSARQFYVSTVPDAGRGLHIVKSKAYACGIALHDALALPPDSGLEIIAHPAGEYAVLEGDCCGDTGAYEAVLASWIHGMGLRAEGPPFAVYETGGSYDRRDVSVKIHQKIEK